MTTMTGFPAENTLTIEREIAIDAPTEVVWEALLAQIGRDNEMPDGTPFPFTLEPHPGGRWFRDLGDDNGHLWGHVQVIKRPYLLEITGPLCMSYPAVSHLQWRIVEKGAGAVLKFRHHAFGALSQEHREGMPEGWQHWAEKVRDRAMRLK